MKKILATVALLGALASPAPALAQSMTSAFSQGRTHVAITGGRGYAFDESYLILGAGVSYYLLDGLSVGLAVESWSGDPGITKVTPSVQYVFHQAPLKPYVGAFYRRTDIERLPELDSVGARAGVYFQATPNFYVGVGGAYESYRDCSQGIYRECDSAYAEVSFTVAF